MRHAIALISLALACWENAQIEARRVGEAEWEPATIIEDDKQNRRYKVRWEGESCQGAACYVNYEDARLVGQSGTCGYRDGVAEPKEETPPPPRWTVLIPAVMGFVGVSCAAWRTWPNRPRFTFRREKEFLPLQVGPKRAATSYVVRPYSPEEGATPGVTPSASSPAKSRRSSPEKRSPQKPGLGSPERAGVRSPQKPGGGSPERPAARGMDPDRLRAIGGVLASNALLSNNAPPPPARVDPVFARTISANVRANDILGNTEESRERLASDLPPPGAQVISQDSLTRGTAPTSLLFPSLAPPGAIEGFQHDGPAFVPTPMWDDGPQDQKVPAPQPVLFPKTAAQRRYTGAQLGS